MVQSINLQSDYHFILNCFTPENVDQLIRDVELNAQGVEFLYAIDTYDIMENYLPYYQMALFSKNDKNLQAQKFICYDYFFGDLNNTNCILLDDYKVELFSVKNKLNKSLRDARAVIKNLEDLKKGTSDFFEDHEKAAAFFKKNLEVILLLLILNDKSNSILDEFFSFLKKRLSISEVQVKNPHDKNSVDQIFNDSVCTQFSISIFECYVAENKRHLLTIQDPDERDIFMKKTFRDIQAVERIMQTNKKFNETGLKYKTIYLSSAKKTNEIFKAIVSLKNSAIVKMASYQDDIHRNIYQFFLFDRLKQEFRNDPENAILLLKDLKDLLVKLSNSSKLFESGLSEHSEYQSLKRIKRFFDDKSDVLDNHFFYGVFEKYKNTFSHLSSANLHTLDESELFQILSEVDKNKNAYKSRIFSLEFSLSQLNQTYDVVETFWGAKDYEPAYSYGQDIIRNPYQHLPILLMIGEKFNSPLKDKLYLFLNLNIEIKDSDHVILKGYVRDILVELDKFQTTNQYGKALKSLIISYLNFVAQSKSKNVNHQADHYKNLEERLIFDLEKQYTMIQHQFSQVNYNMAEQEHKLELISKPVDLLTEIIYILLWLYRRNLKEDSGIQKAIALIDTNFDDPRIYQGIGLSYLSKVYRLLKSATPEHEEIKIYIDLSIKFLKTAQKKYQLLINTTPTTDTSFLIIKNFIAVLNSLADMHVRKYEHPMAKKDYSLIETARECIVEIKNLFNTIQLIYNEHATYSSTEVEIEYYEALHFYEGSMISTAHEKIINASNRLNMIKKFSVTEKLIDRIFMAKEKDINALTHKIINYNSKKA